MYSGTYVRKIDNLAKVEIASELRHILNIKAGDSLEMFVSSLQRGEITIRLYPLAADEAEYQTQRPNMKGGGAYDCH